MTGQVNENARTPAVMDVGVDLTASLSGDSDLVVPRGHLAAQAREGFWLAALQPAAAGKGLGRVDRLRQNDGPMMPGMP